MLGNILNKLDGYYHKVASFFGIVLFIIFLCVFHKAYFSLFLLIPAILLITNKYKENKFFKETDLIVAVTAIALAFIMEFIISYFEEFNVLICILIAISITAFLTAIIASLSFFFAFMTRPFFHYLKLD